MTICFRRHNINLLKREPNNRRIEKENRITNERLIIRKHAVVEHVLIFRRCYYWLQETTSIIADFTRSCNIYSIDNEKDG